MYKTGYVCGEGVVFNACINNQSARKIPIVVLKLVQTLKFHTKAKNKTVRREVTHIVFNKEILPAHKEDWDNSVLTIPSVCPSSQNTSRLIEVSYTLMLSIEPSWPSTPVLIKVPITIGSIPFRQVVCRDITDLPTYQECVFGLECARNDNEADEPEEDTISYAPLYPYYTHIRH